MKLDMRELHELSKQYEELEPYYVKFVFDSRYSEIYVIDTKGEPMYAELYDTDMGMNDSRNPIKFLEKLIGKNSEKIVARNSEEDTIEKLNDKIDTIELKNNEKFDNILEVLANINEELSKTQQQKSLSDKMKDLYFDGKWPYTPDNTKPFDYNKILCNTEGEQYEELSSVLEKIFKTS